MNQKQAQQIVRLREVGNELIAYANIRGEEIRDKLLTARPEDVVYLQAQYAEVRRLATLREEIGLLLENK